MQEERKKIGQNNEAEIWKYDIWRKNGMQENNGREVAMENKEFK